ncbi:MAG: DUF6473 family protein [Novosphingobium sp.]|nr:DUF6473 family protein [Novosphingobium sp.]
MTDSTNPNDRPEHYFADYSKRDYELVDYGFYQLDALPNVGFRGPPVPEENLASGDFFTCIGAAQTVGVYVEKPFPDLLAERIGLPALNLGLGGAAPSFYAQQPELLALANRGRFVILQIMTARSAPNSRLEVAGPILLRDRKTGKVDTSEAGWRAILADEPAEAERYVRESLASWAADYDAILARLTVPVILFYYSYKPADERTNFAAGSVEELYGSFPQFVAMPEVEAVAAKCAGYAECRSKRNLGHLLRSRFTGEPVVVDYGDIHPTARGMIHTHNHYYPTAEMHEDAVDPLLAEIRRLGL